jgi:hypothetical protein
MLRLIPAGVGALLLLSGCGGDSDAAQPKTVTSAKTPAPSSTPARVEWPRPDRYEPDAAEEYANGKRLAARAAATALTYPRGATAAAIARRLGASGTQRRELAAAIEAAVVPRMQSAARVVYPQLAGVTSNSLGAMVVVRQRLRAADGETRTLTRVVDVRLRRDGGPWRLEQIGSVGGRPVPRPAELSDAARRVLDNPRITLSDSARWDIHRASIDEGLLAALDDAARDRRISVSVLRSGHPREVWQTSRPSAHSRGYAADVYAVGGRLVIRQRQAGSEAHALSAALVAGGAAQVGSPWVLPPGGSRSFSDVVHQDHVHVQWSPLP